MSDQAAAVIALTGIILAVVGLYMTHRLEQLRDEMADYMRESKLINVEFAQAVELWKAGNHSEAVAIATRWQRRRGKT